MEIDLRGKRPTVDFDRLTVGDVLPLTVRGIDTGDSGTVQVKVDTVSPLKIRSGKVRINYGVDASRWIDAQELSPYVLAKALQQADIGSEVREVSRGVLIEFGETVLDANAPTLEHDDLGTLSSFVRRVDSTSFLVVIEVSTLAFEGTFTDLSAATMSVTTVASGNASTKARFTVAFSDYPDGGYYLLSDGVGVARLHWQASPWEIERSLVDAGITNLQCFERNTEPPSFSLVGDTVGAVAAPTVESHLYGPIGFTAELDLSALALRAALAGVQSESCIFSVKVNGVTVYSELTPLAKLFEGGRLAGD